MKASEKPERAEFVSYTKYYEYDGMLRAYANRAMFLAILFAMMAMASLGFAIFVRIQPPTIIRVNADGEATLVGAGLQRGHTRQLAMTLSEEAASPDMAEPDGAAPTDLEGRAAVRRFLEHYLSYTPDSCVRNLAESVNMMTNNLRTFTMNKLRDEDTVGRIKTEHIISDFQIREIKNAKETPWSYIVFGVKEIHRVKNGSEATDRIIGEYDIRLVEERRSELNPSGLLVADYSERQMIGERENGLLQQSALEH